MPASDFLTMYASVAGGPEFRVVSLLLETQMSAPFEAIMEGYLDEAAELPLDDSLGAQCALRVIPPEGDPFSIFGLVEAASIETRQHSARRMLQLHIVPKLASLGLGRDHVSYQELSCPQIVQKVLERNGLVSGTDFKLSLTGTYSPLPYVVQQGESDLYFIERMLADAGISYVFEFGAEATVMCLLDDTTKQVSIGTLPIAGEEALRRDPSSNSAGIQRLARHSQVGSHKVKIRDYDFKKPSLLLESSAEMGAATSRERYRSGVVDSDKNRAQRLGEALVAEDVRLVGKTNELPLLAGVAFGVSGHAMDSLNADYLCIRARHAFRDTATATRHEPALDISFDATPIATKVRPKPRAARLALGPESAFVCGPSGEEIHVDGHAQVKVQHHWDRFGKRDDKSSAWMRVAQHQLTHTIGTPRIGFPVLVEHHRGELNDPRVMARLFDGEHVPAMTLPANKTQSVYRTHTTPADDTFHELRIEDKKDKEIVFFRSSRDATVLVVDSKQERVGHDHVRQVVADRAVKIGDGARVEVKGDQTREILEDDSLDVTKDTALEVKGDVSLAVDVSRTSSVDGGSELRIDGSHAIAVAGDAARTGSLGIHSEVGGDLATTIIGDLAMEDATGRQLVVQGDTTSTVKGKAAITAKTAIGIVTKGDSKDTLKGLVSAKADKNLGLAVKGDVTWKVTAGTTFNGKTIEISAKNEISIVCGGTTLTIKPAAIELKSSAIAATGAMLVAKAPNVKRNP